MDTMQNASYLKVSRKEALDREYRGVVDKLNETSRELCFKGVLLGPVSFVVPTLC